MYIVIGKIETWEGHRAKLVACRIIDTETREVKDISIDRVRCALKNGVQVIGFKNNCLIKATNKNIDVHSEIVRNGTSKFRWRKVPRLTGNGDLVDAEDAKYMTVIGWHGFAEMKTYHLIDWQGKEIMMNLQEFIKKVQAEEVNGASYDIKYNRPVLNRDLNKEM